MDDDRRFEAIAMDSDPMIQANGNNGEEQGDNELIEDDQEHEEQEEEEEEEDDEEEEWRRRPPLKILTFPAHAPIQGDTATFSSREPTTLVSAEETDVEMEVATAETPSPSIATTATTTTTTPNRTSDSTAVATPGGSSEDRPSSNSSEESSLPGHQKRFLELQAFLKLCDEADQKDLLEALRSLSAAARSGHAFNLEYRALMLSMEEGREMLRLKMLNVMGGKGGSSPSQMTPSQQENGSTPVGSRLPAPGSVTDLSA